MRAILAINGLIDNKNMTYPTAIAIKQFQKYYSALTIKKIMCPDNCPRLGLGLGLGLG